MKRNGFLSFCFSLCPGAGQMYQGYMKRGLSLILLFVLPIMIGASFMPILGVLSAVVYMYSFFDSLNLHSQIVNGEFPADDFLFHLRFADDDFKKLLSRKGHLLGWGFMALGLVGLYRTLIEPLFYSFLNLISINRELYWELAKLIRSVPGMAMGVLFILVGIWLIRGGKKQEQDFEEYRGDRHE